MAEPENVLQEADRVAGADRSRDYGHPFENHQRIADLWNAYLRHKSGELSASDVALMMILLKVAREIHTPKRDNLVDIAGYAKCLEMIGQRESGNSSATITSSHSANGSREPLVYLASPYSKYEGGRDDAHFLVCEYAAALIERGVRVFSPIAHSHSIADAGEVDPIAHDVWMPLDLAILDRCDVLAVLCLAGWNHSIGVTEEIRHAIDAGKPVVYLDPDEGDLRKIVRQLKIDFSTSQN